MEVGSEIQRTLRKKIERISDAVGARAPEISFGRLLNRTDAHSRALCSRFAFAFRALRAWPYNSRSCLRCEQQGGARFHKGGTRVRCIREGHELLGELLPTLPPFFTSASGRARNFSAHTGANAATTVHREPLLLCPRARGRAAIRETRSRQYLRRYRLARRGCLQSRTRNCCGTRIGE
jgi:hypothetical protein